MVWVIDPVHSHVGFAVRHMMVTTVRGSFTSWRGKLILDKNDLTRSSVEAEIDVNSVSTQNPDRDNHLRTGDFFDAEHHPKISFKSTRIEKKGDGYVVHGDLTLRGVTRAIALDVEYGGISKNTFNKMVAGFSATTTIRRQDFGVNFHQVLETGGVAVGDKVRIELDVQAYEEP
jgi:polyisoprenoid-binding protein YceI